MWRDRASLMAVVDDLFDHAIRAFSADDVLRFLGHEPSRRFKGEVVTDHKRRPEGRRVKHSLRRNWLKFYDKYSVLRVETTINNPRDFKVLRLVKDRRGRKHRRWVEMGKGVANLWRYLQIESAPIAAISRPSPRCSPSTRRSSSSTASVAAAS